MANSILVFPGNEVLRQDWLSCFANAGFRVQPYDEAILKDGAVVLMFTPVLTVDEEWISPEPVWKNFLKDVSPSAKLVQIGYRIGVNLPNYLHLEKPPENIAGFINNAEAAVEWHFRDTCGLDLRDLWSKFRDGHNKGGFMDWFIVAKRRAKIALDKLTDEHLPAVKVLEYLNSDPDTAAAFENMSARWTRYVIYFNTGPFHQQLKIISDAVNRLNDPWLITYSDISLQTRLENMMKDFRTIDEVLKIIEPWFKYE